MLDDTYLTCDNGVATVLTGDGGCKLECPGKEPCTGTCDNAHLLLDLITDEKATAANEELMVLRRKAGRE